MKNQIIKSYTDWLLESLSLNEDFDQATIQQLAQKQDLDKLYELLVATDDEATKALPNYQAIIAWWKRGSADLNLWKRFLKTTTAANSDKLNSANSMYYWMGGKVGAGGTGSLEVRQGVNEMESLESLLLILKTTADTISKIVPSPQFGLDVNGVANLTALIASWKNVPAIATEIQTFIELIKSKGLILKVGKVNKIMQINNTINGFSNNKPYAQYFKQFADKLTNTGKSGAGSGTLFSAISTLNLDTVKKGIAEATAALNSTKTVADYFIADSTMSFENKQAIMAAFKAKIDEHVVKHNKKKSNEALSVEDAINLATNLSIVPKGSTITVAQSATPEVATTEIAEGRFPESPEGDWNSPELKKALTYFGDDSIEIDPTMKAELDSVVKQTVADLIESGGKITGVSVWGEAGTSIVPSSYDKTTKKPTESDYSAAKNVDLVTDRLASLKTAFTTAFTSAGVDAALIKPDPTRDLAKPNIPSGVAWDSAAQTKYAKAKRKSNPQILAEYEATFGKYRYAFGFFQIDYIIIKTEPEQVTPILTNSSAWNILINWADESLKFKWKPRNKRIRLRSSGSPSKPPFISTTACPR